MRRETTEALRTTSSGETAIERVARLAEQTEPLIPERTLPTLPSKADPLLVTLDLVQLHDLVYNAATTYLHTLTNMTRENARRHGERIAARAELIVYSTDYLHRASEARQGRDL